MVQADTCEQPTPEDARAQLSDRLDAARLAARLSKSQLAARAALSRTTVTTALNNTGATPSKETVTALAGALGLDNGPLLALRERAAKTKPVSEHRAGQGPAPGPSVVHTVQGDVSGTVIMAGGEVTLTSHPRREHTPIDDQAVGVDRLSPAQLQVHAAVLPAPDPGGYPFLTPYLPRPHDVRLCESLEPALDGDTSVLVMLTGGSSTGKTRALYEALHAQAPRRGLLRPATANDLLRLLADGQVDEQVVLWLNEAQRFFYGTSAAEAAAALHQLLHQRTGIVAVGTLWTSPYWEELTRFGTSADPHAQVRELLTDPAITHIPVPGHLSPHELDQWEELAAARGDRRMRDALHAGTADRGRVVQHLSGGPALLAVYDQGPGHTFTPVEHALITAAIDARRLGHRAPLPAALLAQAADADLDPRERPTDPDWAQAALTALCTGRRPSGARTDIRHTLTALHPHVPRADAEVGYEPADYLDQHLRRRRADQLGSPALWQALLDHAHDPESLYSLAQAAEARGLFQHAARLYRRAILACDDVAPWKLLLLLTPDTDPHRQGPPWIASHASFTNFEVITELLEMLHEVGPRQVVATLATRAAAHADLSHPDAVAELLQTLHEIGQDQAVTALANRAAAHADLSHPFVVAELLQMLDEVGQNQAVTALAIRAATHADLTQNGVAHLLGVLHDLKEEQALATVLERDPGGHSDPYNFAELLEVLHGLEQEQALVALATRAATHTDPNIIPYVAAVLEALHAVGQKQALTTLSIRAATYTDLTHQGGLARSLRRLRVNGVSRLVKTLHKVGQERSLATLMERDPGGQADLTDPYGIAELLNALRRTGHQQAMVALADRAAACADLTDPHGIAELLRELRHVGLQQALGTLAERAASYADLTDTHGVIELLKELRRTGHQQAMVALAGRAANHADLTDPHRVALLLETLHQMEYDQELTALATRAATHADLIDPYGVAELLSALRRTGHPRFVAVLLERDPATHADLTDSRGIALLLKSLYAVGQDKAVASLLARDPATHADPSSPRGVTDLLEELRRTGQKEAAAVWEHRVLNAGRFRTLPSPLLPYGRELDGSPAQPWSWDELDL